MDRPVRCPSCVKADPTRPLADQPRVKLVDGAGVCPTCRRVVVELAGMLCWVIPGPGTAASSCTWANCGKALAAGAPRATNVHGARWCVTHLPRRTIDLQASDRSSWTLLEIRVTRPDRCVICQQPNVLGARAYLAHAVVICPTCVTRHPAKCADRVQQARAARSRDGDT